MTDAHTTLEALCGTLRNLRPDDVQRWIDNEWVRPDGAGTDYRFREIDVARVRLILELRDDLHVNEDALPIVLSLLDQLYDERRRMRRVRGVLESNTSTTLREELLRLFFAEPDRGE